MSIAASKIATIVRCVERARSERSQAGNGFRRDFTRQDAAILNVTRACESTIDLANILVRKQRLGVPGDARESFALLERGGLISPELCQRMQRTIGFRSIAVRQYQELTIDIVETVIGDGLDDVLGFAETVRVHLGDT